MLATKLSFRWPQCARTDLKKIIHSSNSDGIDLINATLHWDPKDGQMLHKYNIIFMKK